MFRTIFEVKKIVFLETSMLACGCKTCNAHFMVTTSLPVFQQIYDPYLSGCFSYILSFMYCLPLGNVSCSCNRTPFHILLDFLKQMFWLQLIKLYQQWLMIGWMFGSKVSLLEFILVTEYCFTSYHTKIFYNLNSKRSGTYSVVSNHTHNILSSYTTFCDIHVSAGTAFLVDLIFPFLQFSSRILVYFFLFLILY